MHCFVQVFARVRTEEQDVDRKVVLKQYLLALTGMLQDHRSKWDGILDPEVLSDLFDKTFKDKEAIMNLLQENVPAKQRNAAMLALEIIKIRKELHGLQEEYKVVHEVNELRRYKIDHQLAIPSDFGLTMSWEERVAGEVAQASVQKLVSNYGDCIHSRHFLCIPIDTVIGLGSLQGTGRIHHLF